MKPTPEQASIVENFQTGTNGVVEAGAGTGKTSTLRLMANATSKRGVYVAYNRAIKDDAKKTFPSHVHCSTAHGLAFASHGRPMAHRLRGQRITARMTANMLGVTESIRIGDEASLDPQDIARLAMTAVKYFCNSADYEITRSHVPSVKGAEEMRSEIQELVLPYALKAWADLCSANGRLRFDHDHYLKQWALTDPKLRCEFVLLDEAQDANPVIAKVVQDQAAQQVMVGDRSQAIYGWRGALDAMSNFGADWRLALTQSFRFGQAIADEANKWLDILEAPIRLSGNPAIDSRVDALAQPKAILCRTNAMCIGEALEAQEGDLSVAVVGGTGEMRRFVEAAEDLMDGRHTSHQDLVAFGSWEEVQDYVKHDEGADLRVWVKLIEEYGTGRMIQVCDASVNEDRADIIVSTAHKAKGREWETVRIGHDFKPPEEGECVSRPEAMLAYVSATRARNVLDPAGIAWIDALAGMVAA